MMCHEVQTLGVSRFLRETRPRQGRRGKDHAWDPCVVDRPVIALQEVAGQDAPLHPGDRSQWKAAATDRVPCRVDRRVAHALQVLIDCDTRFVVGDPGGIQIEVIDIRYTSGRMYRQVSLDQFLLVAGPGVNQQAIGLTFDSSDFGLQSNLNVELSGGMGQHRDPIRVELLEWTVAAMEHVDLGASTGRDMGELERDVATADEGNAARQLIQLQELRAGGEEFLTW